MENSILQKNWYMVLIKGIIMILLAILIFMSPADALITYALWIGLGFSLAGIFRIFQGFSAKGSYDGWSWLVLEGVLDLFVGFILMANPILTAEILPFLIGFWAGFYGLFLIVDAFSGTGSMGMKLIAGILILILGGMIMFNPLAAGFTMAFWIAIILFVVGFYNVIASFSLK
jgi:uncharacterized membrane protein HdeD (DUF308 family)